MTARYKNYRRTVGIAMAGILGAATTLSVSGQVAAADTTRDVLDVASLQQLPDASLADARGGANVVTNFVFTFLLQSLVKMSGQTTKQTNVQTGPTSQVHVDNQVTNINVTFSSP